MLDSSQLKVSKQIAELQANEVLVVEAPPGSGKTFTVTQTVHEHFADKSVVVLAPTHVALNELRAKFAQLITDPAQMPDFYSTAAFCGRFLKFNKKTKTEENQWSPACKANKSYGLIVLDELGAVPAMDLRRILSGSSPLVALGDREQLKPVNSRACALFYATDTLAETYPTKKFIFATLLEQHRNAGPIELFAKTMSKQGYMAPPACDSIIVHQTQDELLDSFIANLSLGADHSFLAYTNARVALACSRMRTEVWQSEHWVEGELIRMLSHVRLPGTNDLDLLKNGMLATISEVLDLGQVAGLTLVHCVLSTGHTLKLLSPASQELWRSKLANAADAEDWAEYYELKELASLAESGHAMTVHKSQSRSIKGVWLDTGDISSRRALLNTGASRASKVLHVVHIDRRERAPTKSELKYAFTQLRSAQDMYQLRAEAGLTHLPLTRSSTYWAIAERLNLTEAYQAQLGLA